ncbi:MAG: alpha/beta fold hydrolase [Candidatus Obscuribacter sp.]|nr:alpha/beta fold hydrolase [Candidatus Melainabacteria bacterium]MDX1989947.1 alpha/beta fold hydrolase [Candidatus Obscuribacter sp.]
MKDLVSTPLPPIAGVTQIQPELTKLRMSDGVDLFARIWKGKSGAPVVLYLHGIEGHSQWFENTASYLNSRGISIIAPDRRGSGLNPRDRGNMTSYKAYLADLEVILRKAAFDFVGHPIIVLGNCWGAKAASVIAQKDYKPVSGELNLPIAGLVLTSPGIYTKVDYGAGTKFQIAYNSLLGGETSHRKWPIPIEISMFTDNPTFQGFLSRDTLRLTEATSSFFVESFKLSRLAEKATGIEMPLLILQAGSDVIVDVEKVQGWFSKIKSGTKDMRIFPDAHHTLDFDVNWFKEYTHVLAEWILARTPVVT